MNERLTAIRRLFSTPSGRIGAVVCLALIGVALIGPFVAPYNPDAMAISSRLQPPSRIHLLGTDEFGRDVLTRLIYGSRITLMIGTVSVTIGCLLGIPLGMLAGYFGKRVDAVISVLTDMLLAFPNFLLALAIVSVLGPGLRNVIIAVGIRTVPIFTRLVRASTIALREHDYVVAAQALGARSGRIFQRHILPNVLAPIVVLVSLEFPAAVLVGAGLSFLGLGAQPPSPEWGTMLVGARQYLSTAPWMVNAPGLAIMITVLGFNLVGNALRDTLDPRLRLR